MSHPHPIEPSHEQRARHFAEEFAPLRTHFLKSIHEWNHMLSEQACARYGTHLLNRLMFLYFVQQKGWLNDDPAYLSHQLQTPCLAEPSSFYERVITPLWNGQPARSSASPLPDAMLRLCRNLFHFTLPELSIPDSTFQALFTFLDTYSWQLDTIPSSDKKTITPAIPGYFFEQTVNEQQMGAYYTHHDVASYIASSTIIPRFFDSITTSLPAQGDHPWQLLQEQPERYIWPALGSRDALPGESSGEYAVRHAEYHTLRQQLSAGTITSIDDFITHNLNIERFAYDTIKHETDSERLCCYYQALQQISILDPTCGAGAFLFAALDVLLPLYEICLQRLYEIAHRAECCPETHRQQRLSALKTIIEQNICGVDIMEGAIELCQLRFVLQLIAQVDDLTALGTLPDLQRHLRVGNALAPVTDQHTASKQGTQHFDWSQAFGDILERGGFTVIIGNPPYVEYNERNRPPQVADFRTRACANLYTCIIERSQQLLAPQGRHGMILPLAAFATRNMHPFLVAFRDWFSCSWVSFYHFRPAMLFSGGKHASIPTTIYLAKNAQEEQRYSTHLIKWSQEQRAHLFSRLHYCQVTLPPDKEQVSAYYYPKIGQSLENELLHKILMQTPIKHYLARQPNQNSMFYRSAGGLYWKVFVNFPWPYITTSNKQCSFQQDYNRDVFVAVLNSSLFWWYYTVTFDTFNLKDYMLFDFRFTYPQSQTCVMALQQLCQRLMDDFRQHARHLKRGGSDSYTIYARKAKPIIDEIDAILATHYHLTTEELEFIRHYDLKYRLGQDSTE